MSSSAITVRPLDKQDESVWRTMWQGYNEFYKREIADNVTQFTFERILDDKVPMYGAVAVDGESGKLVGFVHWYPHLNTSTIEPVVYLNDLFVDPTIRNKGAGRALIEHVYKHAKDDLGAAKVYWLTQHFNHRAQLLYTKVATKSDFVHYTHVL